MAQGREQYVSRAFLYKIQSKTAQVNVIDQIYDVIVGTFDEWEANALHCLSWTMEVTTVIYQTRS